MDATALVKYPAGAILFAEGDESRDLYIIRSGSVQIFKTQSGKNIPIARLGPGSMLGEMAFISALPRSASAKAEEEVTVSRISIDVLASDAFSVNEWAVNIARVIADRIRRTTDLISDYKTHIPENSDGGDERMENPDDFSLKDDIVEKRGHLRLKGYFNGTHLNRMKESLRSLSVKGCTRVVIDFAEVPDVDKQVLDFLHQLSGDHLFYNMEISIVNVQLIRSKILSIEGIEKLVYKAQLPLKRVAQHDYLIRQDEPGGDMYVVKTGAMKITRTVDDREIVLGHVEAGGVIGEMNLIDNGIRSANVIAEHVTVVYQVSVDEFYKNTYNIPRWFMEMIRVLVFRLRQTNEMLERAVRRQYREEPQSEVHVDNPISVYIDTARPGHIAVSGHLVRANLEYLSGIVNLLIKKGNQVISIEIDACKSIDYPCIRYLLQLFVYLQKRGGVLQIPGAKKEVLLLFKQYDIDLPEVSK